MGVAPPLLRRSHRARCARHDSARMRSWRAGTYDLTEKKGIPLLRWGDVQEATTGRHAQPAPGPQDGRVAGEGDSRVHPALVTGLADVAAVIAGSVMLVHWH